MKRCDEWITVKRPAKGWSYCVDKKKYCDWKCKIEECKLMQYLRKVGGAG